MFNKIIVVMKDFFTKMGWTLCMAVWWSLSAYGQVEIEWDKTYGGDHWDEMFAVAEATDGGYLLGGTSSSSVSGDKTEGPPNVSYNQSDIWVVKTGASGNKEWDKTFSGDGYDNLRVILTTEDGGFLLGGYSNSSASGDKSEDSKGDYDIWLIKTDASGNKEWDKTIGGNDYDNLNEIIPTSDGGYLLGGDSYSDASGDKSENAIGGSDMWIIKLDASYHIEWDKTIGTNASEVLRAIEPTDDGGFLLGGNQRHDPCDPLDFGNYWDYLVIRIDAAGNPEWDRTYGVCGSDFLMDIAPAEEGGFLLGGYSDSEASGEKSEDLGGPTHFWVLRIDDSGTKLWDRAFFGYELNTVLPTEDGGFLLGGSATVRGSSRDYWLVRIDEAGIKLWDQAMGGDDSENLNAMLATSDGGYILGGYSSSDISGDKSENARGWRDYWTVKIKEESAPEPTKGFITGGGWFNSPAGAYEADPFAAGRATFAFNARHKEGEEAARGIVIFSLKSAGLRFFSRSIDWLSVDEDQAFIKGRGRLGMEEGYHFLISVIDQGKGMQRQKDHFRMIIWDQEENIVYDNQQGDPRYAEASLAIQGGSIHIHRQKEKSHPFLSREQEEPLIAEPIEGFRAYPTQLGQEGLWLEFPPTVGDRQLQVAIYDVQGRKMAAKAFETSQQGVRQHWKLDHQDWSSGIYLLILEGDQLNHQVKLVK